MSMDINSASGLPSPMDMRSPVHGTHNASGQWNGLKVKVNDAASMIANAAEEIGFAASEKVEKRLSQRKKPEADKPKVAPPPAEKLEKMQEAMQERLASLLNAVRSSNGNPAALRDALSRFPDPTEGHAALLWLEEQCEHEPSLASLARRERERLEQSEPAGIQAGYNLLEVDADAVGGPGQGAELYRRTILGHGEVSDMLESIIARYGTKDLGVAVDYLLRAVGADLSAVNSSTDKRELESVNNDLFHVRAIGNFSRQFSDDMATLRATRGKSPLPNAGVDTLRVLLKVKNQRLVQLDSLKTTLALEGRADVEYDVQALTRACGLVRSLPPKLFSDTDSHQRLLTAVQKFLDAAIDLEEDLLED